MDIKILVATHKDYFMPEDKMYLPIHVGKALHPDVDLGYQSDADGENISKLNPYFCELTALYWGWKNLRCDYMGLAHYRRHFCLRKNGTNWESVLTQKQAEFLCQNYDVVLPKKRNYYFQSIAKHYAKTHYKEHIELTRDIIAKSYPEYLHSYDKVMKGTKAHMFNMFIMKKTLADEYCAWLFDILFKLEPLINVNELDAFQARLFGRISEILLDVWITKNRYKVKEINYVHIGPYNFMGKVSDFLKAALFGKKYLHSGGGKINK